MSFCRDWGHGLAHPCKGLPLHKAMENSVPKDLGGSPGHVAEGKSQYRMVTKRTLSLCNVLKVRISPPR